jgi:hypothetical protein
MLSFKVQVPRLQTACLGRFDCVPVRILMLCVQGRLPYILPYRQHGLHEEVASAATHVVVHRRVGGHRLPDCDFVCCNSSPSPSIEGCRAEIHDQRHLHLRRPQGSKGGQAGQAERGKMGAEARDRRTRVQAGSSRLREDRRPKKRCGKHEGAGFHEVVQQ